ncbi:hypothetical protein E2562_032913 [Oryza meyeriana var. granulata]|uniref:Uncharacterized protein n=1 Tax=Oryza meyeriana var. granulata TaxID=110450 RepID=A0A6G1F0W9_9ORYZ|nr:hypothetical protein E2562_032913 [Oryza meyeriana var. granulata]
MIKIFGLPQFVLILRSSIMATPICDSDRSGGAVSGRQNSGAIMAAATGLARGRASPGSGDINGGDQDPDKKYLLDSCSHRGGSSHPIRDVSTHQTCYVPCLLSPPSLSLVPINGGD